MNIVDFEILSSELSDAYQYKFVFQEKFATEVCSSETTTPEFRTKHFQCPITMTIGDKSVNFSVAIYGVKDGVDVKLAGTQVLLPSAKDPTSFTIILSDEIDGNQVRGKVNISYKTSKAAIEHALKGEELCCLSVQAAHLNTLVETKFNLTLQACLPGQMKPLVDPVHLTNANSCTFINITDLFETVGKVGVDLVVTDETTHKLYRIHVTPLCPVVMSMPMQIGDPLVLTMQCMYTLEVKKKIVTGLVHTSFMREASIIQTPGSTARKISLTPRRTTTLDMSAAAVGLLGTGQAIPSTKKTLLFLEDSQLNMKATPNSSIIGGIQCAEEINALGEVVQTKPIKNFHEDYLSEISERIHGVEHKHKYIGPSTGAYVVCNSKSEMLVSEMGKRTHKKQSLAINLGTLQVSQLTLAGPVRVRAKLVDLIFSTAPNADVAVLGNTGGAPGKPEQKAVIAYIGLLEEVSRELFNDTGLTACTLEGKLFKPTGVHGAASAALAASALEGSASSGGAGGAATEGEETCIAVKLYVSLVPSKLEEDPPENSDSESASDDEGKSHHKSTASIHQSKTDLSSDNKNNKTNKEIKTPEEEGATENKPAQGTQDTPHALAAGSRKGSRSNVESLAELRRDSNERKNSENAQPARSPSEQHNIEELDDIPRGDRNGSSESSVEGKGGGEGADTTGGGDPPQRNASNAPYNVVTRRTALPDELVGSSSLMALGHSHDKDKSKRVGNSSSVPKLPLGSVGNNRTASAASVDAHSHAAHGGHGILQEDTQFYPVKAPVGAFGEALEPSSLVGLGLRGEKGKSSAAVTGVAFAELVRAELEQKQRLVDELMEDVRARDEAIQVCGYDIRALREEQIRLNNKVQMMEAEKEQKARDDLEKDKVASEILKYPHLMHELDKPALIRNMHVLREKVNGLERDKTALEGTLRQAKGVITEFASLKRDNLQLQTAHQEQTKYLQKMQAKIAQLNAYQDTIKTQEKVIAKMQTIIETKMRSKNALPFQPKSEMIPVPQQQQQEPPRLPDLPDFEALAAQKANEEALLQARVEVEELTEKVQDLEHQLFEAKLAHYDAGTSDKDKDGDKGEAQSETESEAPNSSVLQEMSGEDRAKFEDLNTANARIDELEAEITAKSYRISALEDQLESSTRDYSKEIARLRTKLFELEITAAMVDDGRPGSAGDDEDMEFNLDALLDMPEPGGAVRQAAGSAREVPHTPTEVTPTSSTSRLPSRGEDGNKAMDPGFSPHSSRPPSGSARAAAVSLKNSNNASSKINPMSSSGNLNSNRNEEEERKSPVLNRNPSHDIEKLAAAAAALDIAEKTGESAEEAPSPVKPTATDGDSQEKTSSEPIPNPESKANLAAVTGEEKVEKQENEEHGATENNTAAPVSPVAGDKRPAPADGSPASADAVVPVGDVQDKQPGSDEHEDNNSASSSVRRVPKFRRKSGDGDGMIPKIGIGAEGPQDPDAIDKNIELTMQIIDADQTSPRAEATIRTKVGNQIVMAMLTLSIHLRHDHIRKSTLFKISKLKLHGYSPELLQDRFEPYLKLSVGSKWNCVTGQVKSIGMVSEWVFDTETGFFDKKFSLSDEEIESSESSMLFCVVKKKNVRAQEDFECGTGTLVLTKDLFAA